MPLFHRKSMVINSLCTYFSTDNSPAIYPKAQKSAPISRHASCKFIGPLDRIRTCDHRNRNPVLYPAELRAVIYPYIIPHLPPFVNPPSRFFLIFVKTIQLIKAASNHLPQSYISRKNSKTLLTNRFRCGIILTLLRDNANQIRRRSRVAKGTDCKSAAFSFGGPNPPAPTSGESPRTYTRIF